MENKKKMLAAKITKTGGSYFISIPPMIMELMDFKEGDIVRVPFLEFEKVIDQGEKKEESEVYELQGSKSVTVKLRDREPVTITQDDVLKILENPSRDMKKYRTAFLIWNGERYGIKKVCTELFGFNYFNTVEGEKYLNDLGFRTGRTS